MAINCIVKHAHEKRAILVDFASRMCTLYFGTFSLTFVSWKQNTNKAQLVFLVC